MGKVNIFYNTSKGHFHDFSVLLDTAMKQIKDFIHVKDSFNKDLLKRINVFRTE